MQITNRQWALALLAALLLHAGLLAALALRPPEEGALAAGVGGYEIGLGAAGGAPGDDGAESALPPEAETDATAQSASEASPEELAETVEAVEVTEAMPVETSEMIEAAPVEEAAVAVEPAPPVIEAPTQDLPEEVAEAVAQPVEDPLPAELAEAAPAEEALAAVEPTPPQEEAHAAEPATPPAAKPQEETQAEAVVDAPPPKAKPRPPQPKKAQKQPAPPPTQTAAKPEAASTEPKPATKDAEAQEASTSEASDTQTAAVTPLSPGIGGKSGTELQTGAGSGDGTSGGGLKAAKLAYKTIIQAWLEKHKKYPRRARLRNQQGTPHVHFEIDSNGGVLVSGIEETSGYRLLDRAAIKTVERADPMPKPPKELQGQPLRFTVPMPFTLK